MQIEVPNDRLAFIINNRDKLTDLRELVTWVLEVNTFPVKLIIIDNNSSYKPLFDFYFQLKKEVPICDILYLTYNAGSRAIEKIKIKGGLPYYIYTDSDVVPDKDCPPNVIQHLVNLAGKYSDTHKIGLSIKVDDIPESYPFIDEVILGESENKQHITEDGDAYIANIKSTFALYRKNYSQYKVFTSNLRTLGPYLAKHLSWYRDPSKLPDDYIHYINRCNSDSIIGKKFKQLLDEKNKMEKNSDDKNKLSDQFLSKIVGKKFNYKSVTGLNIPIRFESDCRVVGENGEEGTFCFIGRRVRIIWDKKLQATDILDFNTNFDKYTGASSRYGNIRGKVLKQIGIPGLVRKVENGVLRYSIPDISIVVSAYGISTERKLNFLRWNEEVFLKENVHVFLISDVQENLSEFPFAQIIQYPKKQDVFSIPRTINYGLRHIPSCEIVVKSDIDIVFSRQIFKQLRQNISNRIGMVCIPSNLQSAEELSAATDKWNTLPRDQEAKGACFAMTYNDWKLLKGYDERIVGWGGEDTELFLRASKKMKMYVSDIYPIFRIDHPNEVVKQEVVVNNEMKPTDKVLSKLSGRAYHYKSKSENTIITFLDDTKCIGWNNLIFGNVKSKNNNVRIAWNNSEKGISILDFNPTLVRYTGISTVDGNVFGEFIHTINDSTISDLRGEINEIGFDYIIDEEINENVSGKQTIILYLNYYVDPDEVRDKEIKECFFNNLENPTISKIVCFKDHNTPIPTDSSKVEYVVFDKRPTYANFFSAMRSFSRSDNINILINSDIYFDSSLKLLLKHKFGRNQCFAISRWEAGEKLTMKVGRDSQDVWVIKGKPLTTLCANFCLGIAGCDNRLAYELKQAGYNVSNPSQTIKCVHVHHSQLRRYSKNPSDCVPGPYLMLPQTSLKR